MKQSTSSCGTTNVSRNFQLQNGVLTQIRLAGSKHGDETLIYPNPADKEWNIDLKRSQLILTKVILQDAAGKQIEVTTPNIASSVFTIDCIRLAAGMYFAKLLFDDGSMEQVKLMKQ